jgi:hypothetical protein
MGRKFAWTAVKLAAAWCLTTVVCTAQQPAAPSSGKPSSVGPDIVVLKDGSRVRGTLSELMKGQYVVIVLVSGEVKRFEWNEIEFAGSEANAPAATAPREQNFEDEELDDDSTEAAARAGRQSGKRVRPLVIVKAEEVELQLDAAESDVTFHVSTAMAVGSGGSARGYDRICTAPCTASMAAGTYTFGLSRGTDDPVEVDERVTVSGDRARLTGELNSRAGVRGLGWGMLIGGPLLGLASLFVFTEESCVGGSEPNPTIPGDTGMDPICSDAPTTTGIVAVIVGVAVVAPVGYILTRVSDSASVTVSGSSARPSAVARGGVSLPFAPRLSYTQRF